MQYIPVKTFDDYISANIWLSKLLNEEIDCYLKDEYTATIDPILINAIGGIKLCVNENQLQQAKELIAIFENENKQQQKCPHCGSLHVQYVVTTTKSSNWLLILLSIITFTAPASGKKVYHCYDCGFEFDEIKTNE